MGCLGNLLWFLCGGMISGLSWCLAGCLWCITIIGIPVGMQCFKLDHRVRTAAGDRASCVWMCPVHHGDRDPVRASAL